MEYIATLKPYLLITYYVFISFIILTIILDNKRPGKSFAFIFLILLFPVGGVLIYLLFGAQYHKKKLLTKKRYFDKVYLNKIFEGNKPTTTIFIDKLTPQSLGKLIALYEHKIFVQGVLWNVFSYDQFGVELGKQLASNVLNDMRGSISNEHDYSTKALLNVYKD